MIDEPLFLFPGQVPAVKIVLPDKLLAFRRRKVQDLDGHVFPPKLLGDPPAVISAQYQVAAVSVDVHLDGIPDFPAFLDVLFQVLTVLRIDGHEGLDLGELR